MRSMLDGKPIESERKRKDREETMSDTKKTEPAEEKSKPSCSCRTILTCVHSPLLKKTVKAQIDFSEWLRKHVEGTSPKNPSITLD